MADAKLATLAILTLAAALAGCGALAPGGLPPGTKIADARQALFKPSGEYALPGGGTRLEFAQGALPPLDRIAVPTAVALFPADLTQPPRSWAERTYELARYTVMPRGGHFPAVEEPVLLADDITEFFRTVR